MYIAYNSKHFSKGSGYITNSIINYIESDASL